jgi:hypothetical protein
MGKKTEFVRKFLRSPGFFATILIRLKNPFWIIAFSLIPLILCQYLQFISQFLKNENNQQNYHTHVRNVTVPLR